MIVELVALATLARQPMPSPVEPPTTHAELPPTFDEDNEVYCPVLTLLMVDEYPIEGQRERETRMAACDENETSSRATSSRNLAANLRLLVGLHANRRCPYVANAIIYGPIAGHRRWRAARRATTTAPAATETPSAVAPASSPTLPHTGLDLTYLAAAGALTAAGALIVGGVACRNRKDLR